MDNNSFNPATDIQKDEYREVCRIEQLPSYESRENYQTDRKYKIVIVGDGGVGKTSFVKRYISGTYSRVYKATVGVETSVVLLKTTNNMVIQLEIWDTAGQEMNSGLSDIFYIGADGFIVFFDVTSRITHQNVPHWINKALCINDNNLNMPIIVCGNKCDMVKERKVKRDAVHRHLQKATQYFDISVHALYNLEKPLLYLCRHLTGDPNLEFVTNTAITPSKPTNIHDQSLLADLEQAQQANIHDEDNQFL